MQHSPPPPSSLGVGEGGGASLHWRVFICISIDKHYCTAISVLQFTGWSNSPKMMKITETPWNQSLLTLKAVL